MYDLDGIYWRIEKAFMDKGYDNSRQFSKSTEDENGKPRISEQTLANWRKGKMPDLKSLALVSELLDVDMDYFLGKQKLFKKEDSDIQKITGLSEDAIHILCEQWSKQKYKDGYSYYDWSIFGKKCLSWLIENGLFEECVAQGHYARGWAVANCTLDGFPESLKEIVTSAVKNESFENVETALIAQLTFSSADTLTDLISNAHEYIVNNNSYIFDDDEEECAHIAYNKACLNGYITMRFEKINDETKDLIEKVFIRYYPFIMLISQFNDKPTIVEFRDWHNSKFYVDLLNGYRDHLLAEERK